MFNNDWSLLLMSKGHIAVPLIYCCCCRRRSMDAGNDDGSEAVIVDDRCAGTGKTGPRCPRKNGKAQEVKTTV